MSDESPFKKIEDAKQYLKDIKVNIVLDVDTLPDDIVFTLAKANWASGLRPGDVSELEL